MVTPHPSFSLLRWLPIIALCAVAAGCSSLGTQKDADQAQALLPMPETKVRTAVIQVLQEEGYLVSQGEEGGAALTTGYRQEIDSPSDWLLRRRFGTGRSRVNVTLAPEGESATRLTIQVIYEGKDGLFESWKAYPAPLPQSAANQLRLVKNALGLL